MLDESFVIPGPRTESPLDAPALGWGIIGPGRIASTFVESLVAHTRQQIVAVGSRSLDIGEQEFCTEICLVLRISRRSVHV